MSFKVSPASTSEQGVVRIGSGISVTANGTISTTTVALFDQAYFFDTTTQNNPVASAINLITFNSAAVNVGITLIAGSQINVSKTANYNIQFSAQVDKTDGNVDVVDFWILRNGAAYPNTNTVLSLINNNQPLAFSWSYLLSFNAGDNIQIVWQSLDTAARLLSTPAQVAPVRPVTPSVRCTIVQL